MTATSRSAIFRFEYSASGEAFIVVNPNSDEGEGSIEIDLDKRQIRGRNPVHRIYQGSGKSAGFSGWFVIEWPETLEIVSHGTYKGNQIFTGTDRIADSSGIGAFISFNVKKRESIVVKAASSFTGIPGALKNLHAEIPDFDFDAVRSRLTGIWNQQLGKINFEGGSDEERIKFYSALYRASFLPRAFNDVDGLYPAFGSSSVNAEMKKMADGRTYYEDYSMWDTYRALHPLLNIISPSKSADMMQSLVLKYEQGGWLPIFPCWNSYTAAMIGDHCIAAIADAYTKGIRGFDIDKAYEGMRRMRLCLPKRWKIIETAKGGELSALI